MVSAEDRPGWSGVVPEKLPRGFQRLGSGELFGLVDTFFSGVFCSSRGLREPWGRAGVNAWGAESDLIPGLNLFSQPSPTVLRFALGKPLLPLIGFIDALLKEPRVYFPP